MKKNNSPRFEDVKDVALRTWNRCAIVFNLRADVGEEAAKQYVAGFDDIAKQQIKAMFNYIEVKGYEFTKREIINGAIAARSGAANG